MNSAHGPCACAARSRSNATSCSAWWHSRSIKYSASRSSGPRRPERRPLRPREHRENSPRSMNFARGSIGKSSPQPLVLRGHLAPAPIQVWRADENEALIEMDDALLDPQRALAQFAHRGRQLRENIGRAAEILARKLDPVALAQRLRGRQFAFVDGPLQQQPGGDLHEAGGEPHAFGRIGERGDPRKLARLFAPRPIEIAGGLLDQRHPLSEQVLEGRRSGEAMNEGDGGWGQAGGRGNALPSVVGATHTLDSDPGSSRSAYRSAERRDPCNYSAAGTDPRIYAKVTLTLGRRPWQRAKESRPKAAFKELGSEASRERTASPFGTQPAGRMNS